MCGIIGIFNHPQANELIHKGLTLQQHRGQDGFGWTTQTESQISDSLTNLSIPQTNSIIAHSLHAIVSHVKQPLHKQFATNCEIYNWKELAQEHGLTVQNDAELLYQLLSQHEYPILKQINGVYACCLWKNNTVFLARDLVGEKPLCFAHENNTFAFASEKKTLLALGFSSAQELNPRQLIKYNTQTNDIEFIKREFFTLPTETTESKEQILQTLEKKLIDSIIQRVPEQKVGILFSGGIDSTFIAHVLQKHNIPFTCYTAAIDDPLYKEAEDLVMAKKIALQQQYNLKIKTITLSEVPSYIKKVVDTIESTNVIKVGVALPFYLCCEQAKEDGVKVLFSGLGSEEIFAGYDRHSRALDSNKECVSGLRKMYERDLYRDDLTTMKHTIELRLPFLDGDLIKYALSIPSSFKINTEQKKIVLREVAQNLGLPQEFAQRPKKAAQYGSRFDKAIQKLAKKEKFDSKSSYLDSFTDKKNQKLAVLLSTGKDSVYAMYTMVKQNYPIACLLTMQSTNQDSYMFHTPAVELAKLQAESMELPLLTQQTTGEKEAELNDLHTLIKRAKTEYNIDGIVTGALYSTYQRERIEKIAEDIGIQVFSPLWHIDQEEEMRNLLDKDFEIIFTAIAADGLNKKWLNTPITHQHVSRLVALNEKIGLNIAGEGGEFESLVLHCPLFTKRIIIKDAQIISHEDHVARLIIRKAYLE